jgi:hypothetical protein
MLINPEKLFRIASITAEIVRDQAYSLFKMQGVTKCLKVTGVAKALN